ncbi:MFS transporter [Nocardia goodfellowii]
MSGSAVDAAVRVDSLTAGRASGIVSVLAAAGITAALVQTLVVPLLGDLPRLLHTSPANASWVVTATLLAAAVAVPIAGRLGDRYGKRRMLLLSTVPLVLGGIVCALASSVAVMIVGRGMQGIGMGIIPLGISALREVLPEKRVSSAIALMSSSMGVGAAFGLPLAAAVAEHASWRVPFSATAALSAVVAGLIWWLVPAVDVVRNTADRFDYLGAVGLSTALICLLLAISKGGSWGWASALTIGLFVTAGLTFPIWGWWELRVGAPLVDLRVAARPRVLLTNLASVVVGFAMYVQSLIVPQLRRLPEDTGYGLGQSMLEMGLWMAPAGFVMMAVAQLGARLTVAQGPKFTLSAGSGVIAIGYFSSTLWMNSTGGLLAVSCLVQSGIGLAYGAMPTLIMSAVPDSETASANSFNTLMRSIGTSLAAAVVGVVLAQLSVRLNDVTLPSEDAFRLALVIGGGSALTAAVVAMTIPAHRESARQ